jgi:filamentous hemagglutinin family protein
VLALQSAPAFTKTMTPRLERRYVSRPIEAADETKMSQRKFHCVGIAVVISISLCVANALFNDVHAQVATAITPDGTLGTTVLQTGNIYDINGGRIIGQVNQFHSFGQFSVGTGDVASFNGPAGIRNVVSRVTGGLGSNIDGTVASTIAGANLFLLNPAGIMFGPNAQLSVTGSFHASTGDYIKLGNDGIFYADPARASLLTVSPPSAFGFLTSNPGPI